MAKKIIVGIDEVGRGPLAGPVTVAAIAATENFNFQFPISKRGLRDSKKLSHKQRNEWLKTFKNYANKGNTLYFATSSVGHHIIDQIGITAAARLAVSRVLKKISCYVPGVSSSVILLDGSLYAPRKYLFQKTIIRGDENVPVIAAASVIAKVCRDKKMIRLSKKFPQYSFDLHKGYGTKKHSNAIEKYGLSQAHRRSFCKKFIKVL